MNTTHPSNKEEHLVWYLAGAVAAYFGVTYLVKTMKKAQPKKMAVIVSPNAQAVIPIPDIALSPNTAPKKTAKKLQQAAVWQAEYFPLRKGMKGTKIAAVQQRLGLSPDGGFGTETEQALLQRFGVITISTTLYNSITNKITTGVSDFKQSVQDINKGADNVNVLQLGVKGKDVYRLQKWLGFKDKAVAKRGDKVADSSFGNQTATALQQRTGKTSITTAQLNQAIAGNNFVNVVKSYTGI